MRPFLKYAGGKYQIIARINKVLPQGNRLIEPFVGAGSVFANTNYSKYLLADNNLALINLFKFLKQEQEDFIYYCAEFFGKKNNTEKKYQEYKYLFNTTQNLRLKSALFLYLNKHAFNGLMRQNSSGHFNVSFGKYKKPCFPMEKILYFADKLKHATVTHGDFSITMKKARVGDVVYCDPPYIPLSNTSNFTKYDGNNFDLTKQQLLAKLAKKLANKGIPVVISNHYTSITKQLYADAKIYKFAVQRYISCKGNERNKVQEMLAVFT